MLTKKSDEHAQTFMVTLPLEGDVVFLLGASAEAASIEKNFLWIRAREMGTEEWSQTVWTEMEDQEGGFFVSRKISPQAFWMVPGTTYEIEVVPETFEDWDIDLVMETVVKEKKETYKSPMRKDSLFDNPIFWMVILLSGLLGVVWRLGGA